jgi:DNA-binding MarR family transcriptional regulator
MADFDDIFNIILENFQKIFYPEEWLATDLAFSRTELLLIMLLERRGDMIMSELAGELNAPMSTMTGLADKLVKSGYLGRNRTESDRRVVTVGLTEEGRQVAARLKSTAMEYLHIIDETLSNEEKEILLRIYHKVKDVLDNKSVNLNHKGNLKPTLQKIEIE